MTRPLLALALVLAGCGGAGCGGSGPNPFRPTSRTAIQGDRDYNGLYAGLVTYASERGGNAARGTVEVSRAGGRLTLRPILGFRAIALEIPGSPVSGAVYDLANREASLTYAQSFPDDPRAWRSERGVAEVLQATPPTEADPLGRLVVRYRDTVLTPDPAVAGNRAGGRLALAGIVDIPYPAP